MNESLRKFLVCILVLVLAGSLCTVFYKSAVSRQAGSDYDDARELATQPEPEITPPPAPQPSLSEPTPPPPEEKTVAPPVLPQPEEPPVWREAPVTDDPYMETLAQTDLAALREVNPDVLAWIVIPDTQLAYPIMYSGDNDYYLRHTWKKESSSVGSVFLEQHCSTDFSDFNTILYAHRMMDGSMFGSLKHYKKQDHWAENPYVYIFDDAGSHRYEIFAAYEASVTGTTYQLKVTKEQHKQTFIDNALGWSVIDTGVTPTVNDRILTLSTCTGQGYDTRWVVMARLAAADTGS